MTPEVAVDLLNECLNMVMLLVALTVVPSLIVGLLVSLFQAATQINEQTLSFLPKMLVTLLVIGLAGRWMVGYLMDFCVSIFERAATLVG
ncbi:flagellar biosynthesis protein FliQ [Paucibacter sp. O1-1]|uniref:flagellar biosynthesis protein FliQ n=1 Tax=Roseateles TaxID=93681 RepID=UPI0010F9A55B|nr:flagellar biosynthesis protein FliQ [Paucibacter sp. M5-1]MCU7375455.1 flagellar biosynthesis protein FliQ [Paucibacter sp. O1-1]MCZ7884650.1 flagellar biosynthesis protein FliQ [Paucibacter sp. M5-1]MDA3830462.1 flagellar biosynthesis protein FliQ [Paucibacter sp. O1-1]